MKFNKILVPVDFSEHSVTALNYAFGFAKSSQSEVILLHITEIGSGAPQPETNNLMNSLLNDTSANEVPVTPLFREGKIVDQILQVCNSHEIDLVVMGTRGAGNISRNIFGTNTTRIIGKSEIPVLAVPSEALYRPVRKVVMAIDFKHKSDKIIEEFINLMKQQNSVVLLTYVHSDKGNANARELQQLTDDLKQRTGYEKIVCKVIQSEFFPSAMENFALDIEADMMVMVTHPRGFFESIFDPSETKQYAFHTSIPLLAIPYHKTPVFFF